jgi:hypothetical protein
LLRGCRPRPRCCPLPGTAGRVYSARPDNLEKEYIMTEVALLLLAALAIVVLFGPITVLTPVILWVMLAVFIIDAAKNPSAAPPQSQVNKTQQRRP